VRIMSSCMWVCGVLLYYNISLIICSNSFCGMLVYISLISNEHSFVLCCSCSFFRLHMSSVELRILKALGKHIVFLSILVVNFASL
jgi:hypothetical protein